MPRINILIFSDSAVSDSKMSMVAVMPPKGFLTKMASHNVYSDLNGGLSSHSQAKNQQLLKRVAQLLDNAKRNYEEELEVQTGTKVLT